MRKYIIAAAALFLAAGLQAQTAQPRRDVTDSIGDVVIRYLATHQPDSIYLLAGNEFKSHLSQSDFKSICETQLFPLNDFKKVSFVKRINNVNKYKVEGAPALQLLVSLDSENKLYTFLIQPFSED